MTPREIADKMATCPFVGSAVAEGDLQVGSGPTNSQVPVNPLASIQDVKELGNSGGGDLGNIFVLFALGNHAFMFGANGQLSEKAPDDQFSLQFPGSKGSHHGHSGILEGDPTSVSSGRFSESDFQRLESFAKGGVIKRSDAARLIAQNLEKDAKSVVHGTVAVETLAGAFAKLVQGAGLALLQKVGLFSGSETIGTRELAEELTQILGGDNLVGSCGEWGLLFAFFANRPDATMLDGEPALLMSDLRGMFADKRLPEGWRGWKKTAADWIKNTHELAKSAIQAYRAPQSRAQATTAP